MPPHVPRATRRVPYVCIIEYRCPDGGVCPDETVIVVSVQYPWARDLEKIAQEKRPNCKDITDWTVTRRKYAGKY